MSSNVSKQFLQDTSFPLGGWRRNTGVKGSPADFEVRVMNLVAEVGRRGGQSPAEADGLLWGR